MATMQPGSTPSLPRDAHYHPIRVTEKWAAFKEAMAALATDSSVHRAAEDARRKRATTYERGELGYH